jgi:hypothetical protein
MRSQQPQPPPQTSPPQPEQPDATSPGGMLSDEKRLDAFLDALRNHPMPIKRQRSFTAPSVGTPTGDGPSSPVSEEADDTDVDDAGSEEEEEAGADVLVDAVNGGKEEEQRADSPPPFATFGSVSPRAGARARRHARERTLSNSD